MKTTSMLDINLRIAPNGLRTAALVGIAVLLQACGGGSGANIPGFAGPPPVVVVPPPVVIPPVVSAKNWCGARQVQAVAGEAEDGRVVFGPIGTANLVWTQRIGASDSVRARSYSQASDFGTETALGTGFSQQITSDASGNLMAVWKQGNDIFANRFVLGAGWGTAQSIETGAERADSPQISSDASGNVMAVWSQANGGIYNIWANRYTPSAGWGTAQLIETNDTGWAQSPQIATDASGNVTAVWGQRDGAARTSLWSNRFTASTGLWGTAQLIETDDTGNAQTPKVVVGPGGNVVAAWMQYDGTRFVLNTNLYTIGVGWGTATQIPTGSIDINDGTFTVDSNGHILALWTQQNAVGSKYGIWANRFVVGSGWGSPVLIESDSATDMAQPRIASDGNGDSIAMWIRQGGGIYNVRSVRYTAGSGWGVATTLSNTTRYTVYPDLAVDSSGNAMAVWSQDIALGEGTQKRIWANSYASSCPD